MLLSTTDILEGFQIEEYLGIVSERVVVGTGVFSEFFASFTDVLGGRSKTFEKRISELQHYAVTGLIKKARGNKANGVIGIKYDFEEISGKNMSMFMIIVIGTAVRCNKTEKVSYRNQKEDGASVILSFSNEISKKIEVFEVVDELKSLFNNQKVIVEELDAIVKKLIKKSHYSNNIVDYLLDIIFSEKMDFDVSNWELYASYLSECDSEYFSELYINKILDIIGKSKDDSLVSKFNLLNSEMDSIKIESIERLIKNVDIHLYYFTIKNFFSKFKKYYSESDLLSLKRISETLFNEVYDEIEVEEEKIDGKAWICRRCGRTNDVTFERCECGADMEGILRSENRILKLKSYIDKIIRAIEMEL